MKLTLKQLETFVWVADLGSFRRAATHLNTTQPNISSRISSLEKVLAIKLLDRNAGSVKLTPRGAELLDHARKVLASTDDFIEAADQSNLVNGVLRLGVTEMIVNTWLQSFLHKFKQRYPSAIIELTVDLSLNLEAELEQHNIDLAFQSGPFQMHSSGSHELGEFPITWVMSPQLCARMPDKITIDDLVKIPIIARARSTKHYAEIQAHFSSIKTPCARITQCNNLAACVQMAVDGYGIAPILTPMVDKELSDGRLLAIDYPWRPSNLEFFARYDKQKSNTLIKAAAELASQESNKLAARYA